MCIRDSRVRDAQEYLDYIHDNPVKRGLATFPEQYPYGSASGKFVLDEVHQRLKPIGRAADMQG